MRLTWKTVDNWRESRGIEVAELARRAGIPERTIYAGVRNDSRLQAATKTVIRSIFPDEFQQAEGGEQ